MTATIYYPIPKAGFLRISGSSRVDFLQRQTSNDLRKLGDKRASLTVLTSPVARILDVFWVFEDGESLGVISLPERVRATESYLRSRIFFKDDVQIADQSAASSQILLDGPRAGEILDALGAQAPDLQGVARFEFQNSPVSVIAQPGFGRVAYRMTITASDAMNLRLYLDKQGLSLLSAEAYERLRIEAGIPGHQTELIEAYTPLEVGLQDLAISIHKGCFTGQEVIARQINYDKITRRLVGVQLDAPVELSATIRVDGKSVGQITSITNSPRWGTIGLAVIKRPFDQPKTPVEIDGVVALVAQLPF